MVFEFGEVVQDVAGGTARCAGEDKCTLCRLGRGQEAKHQRLIARDAAISPLGQSRAAHAQPWCTGPFRPC